MNRGHSAWRLILGSLVAGFAFASPASALEQGKETSVKGCDKKVLAYEVRDFAPLESPDRPLWTHCGTRPATAEVLKSIPDEALATISSFEAGLEANRRGTEILENARDYKSLKTSLRFFQLAANQGHAEAYSNLALTHFALSNLKQAGNAAQVGALLRQPEAMGLLAFFKIEAIHTERDLPGAFALIEEAEMLGADLEAVKSQDISYQFFPSHWVELQESLKKAGLFKGKTDGIFGQDSKVALAAYQAREGLPVTTKIQIKLLSSLNLLDGFNDHMEAQKYIYGKF